MKCPKCEHEVSGVLSTRHTGQGTTERRRFCANLECGVRYTTVESVSLEVQMTMPGERRPHPLTGTSAGRARKRPKPTGVIGSPRKPGGDLDQRIASKANKEPLTPRYNPTSRNPAAAFLAPVKSRARPGTRTFGTPKV